MKKIWVFLGGIVTGMVLVFAILFMISRCSNNIGLTYFDEPGDIIEGDAIEVFQVLPSGDALAWMKECHNIGDEEMYTHTSIVVMLPCSKRKAYYDNELIKIPDGMCARQIGVYNYMNKETGNKTVPIIKLFNE